MGWWWWEWGRRGREGRKEKGVRLCFELCCSADVGAEIGGFGRVNCTIHRVLFSTGLLSVVAGPLVSSGGGLLPFSVL